MNADELRGTVNLEFADIHSFSYDLLRGEVRIDATDVYHIPTKSWASAIIRFTGADYFRSIGAMRREIPAENELHLPYEGELSYIGAEARTVDWGPVTGRKRLIEFNLTSFDKASIVVDEGEEHILFCLFFSPAAVDILALDCVIDLTPTPAPDLSWLER